MSELSRVEFEERLMNLAAKSPEVREKLLTDPKSEIERLLSMELPEEVKIEFHEEDANTLHFVLPPAGDELHAAELASVSGGVCWDDCGSQQGGK